MELHIVFDCSEGIRILGRLRLRWEDNIKVDLDLFGSEWGPLEGCYECGDEYWGSIKQREFLD
jgi:hypothetical protein